MARYRKYPKYEPKIPIAKSWADELMMLNSQQLTLQLQEMDEYEARYEGFHQRIHEKISLIIDLIGDVIAIRDNHKNEMINSNSSFRNIVFNDLNYNQALELEQTVRNNRVVKQKIVDSNVIDKEVTKIMEERWVYEQVIFSKLFKRSEAKFKPIITSLEYRYLPGSMPKVKWDIASVGWTHSRHIHAPGNSERFAALFSKLRVSIKEIRRRINKKEKSAKLASYQDKSRNVGQSLMISMKVNLKSPYHCPYCNKKTAKTKLHVDHINPVSNGGLSVVRNLVPVCSECNLDKSDLSLRAFCKKNKLDFESICDILESMGKFI